MHEYNFIKCMIISNAFSKVYEYLSGGIRIENYNLIILM